MAAGNHGNRALSVSQPLPQLIRAWKGHIYVNQSKCVHVAASTNHSFRVELPEQIRLTNKVTVDQLFQAILPPETALSNSNTYSLSWSALDYPNGSSVQLAYLRCDQESEATWKAFSDFLVKNNAVAAAVLQHNTYLFFVPIELARKYMGGCVISTSKASEERGAYSILIQNCPNRLVKTAADSRESAVNHAGSVRVRSQDSALSVKTLDPRSGAGAEGVRSPTVSILDSPRSPDGSGVSDSLKPTVATEALAVAVQETSFKHTSNDAADIGKNFCKAQSTSTTTYTPTDTDTSMDRPYSKFDTSSITFDRKHASNTNITDNTQQSSTSIMSRPSGHQKEVIPDHATTMTGPVTNPTGDGSKSEYTKHLISSKKDNLGKHKSKRMALALEALLTIARISQQTSSSSDEKQEDDDIESGMLNEPTLKQKSCREVVKKGSSPDDIPALRCSKGEKASIKSVTNGEHQNLECVEEPVNKVKKVAVKTTPRSKVKVKSKQIVDGRHFGDEMSSIQEYDRNRSPTPEVEYVQCKNSLGQQSAASMKDAHQSFCPGDMPYASMVEGQGNHFHHNVGGRQGGRYQWGGNQQFASYETSQVTEMHNRFGQTLPNYRYEHGHKYSERESWGQPFPSGSTSSQSEGQQNPRGMEMKISINNSCAGNNVLSHNQEGYVSENPKGEEMSSATKLVLDAALSAVRKNIPFWKRKQDKILKDLLCNVVTGISNPDSSKDDLTKTPYWHGMRDTSDSCRTNPDGFQTYSGMPKRSFVKARLSKWKHRVPQDSERFQSRFKRHKIYQGSKNYSNTNWPHIDKPMLHERVHAKKLKSFKARTLPSWYKFHRHKFPTKATTTMGSNKAKEMVEDGNEQARSALKTDNEDLQGYIYSTEQHIESSKVYSRERWLQTENWYQDDIYDEAEAGKRYLELRGMYDQMREYRDKDYHKAFVSSIPSEKALFTEIAKDFDRRCMELKALIKVTRGCEIIGKAKNALGRAGPNVCLKVDDLGTYKELKGISSHLLELHQRAGEKPNFAGCRWRNVFGSITKKCFDLARYITEDILKEPFQDIYESQRIGKHYAEPFSEEKPHPDKNQDHREHSESYDHKRKNLKRDQVDFLDRPFVKRPRSSSYSSHHSPHHLDRSHEGSSQSKMKGPKTAHIRHSLGDSSVPIQERLKRFSSESMHQDGSNDESAPSQAGGQEDTKPSRHHCRWDVKHVDTENQRHRGSAKVLVIHRSATRTKGKPIDNQKPAVNDPSSVQEHLSKAPEESQKCGDQYEEHTDGEENTVEKSIPGYSALNAIKQNYSTKKEDESPTKIPSRDDKQRDMAESDYINKNDGKANTAWLGLQNKTKDFPQLKVLLITDFIMDYFKDVKILENSIPNIDIKVKCKTNSLERLNKELARIEKGKHDVAVIHSGAMETWKCHDRHRVLGRVHEAEMTIKHKNLFRGVVWCGILQNYSGSRESRVAVSSLNAQLKLSCEMNNWAFVDSTGLATAMCGTESLDENPVYLIPDERASFMSMITPALKSVCMKLRDNNNATKPSPEKKERRATTEMRCIWEPQSTQDSKKSKRALKSVVASVKPPNPPQSSQQ